MVHVQEGALRTFGQDGLAVGERVGEVVRRVGDVGVDLLVEVPVLLHDGVHVQFCGAVDLAQDVVLLLDGGGQLGAQHIGVEQVYDADAASCELVHVGRADAAAGSADGARVAPALLGLVERLVVGHDKVRVVAHLEAPLARETERLHLRDLVQQRDGVDDHAVPDHAGRAFVEDAGRDKVQHERLLGVALAPLDGVAGVRAALVAGDDVHLRREQVDDLSFPLVAPLGADDDGDGHFLSRCGALISRRLRSDT